MVYSLASKFIKLFFLQEKPENIPYSKFILLGLCIILYLEKTYVNLQFVELAKEIATEKNIIINVSFGYSSLIILISLLVTFVTIGSLLAYYKIPERTVQVVTAFLSVEVILALLFLIWIFVMSSLPTPLKANSFAAITLVMAFILLLYWQFMVYIHIFLNSINISILQAGLFALVYMLLQHNISEALLSLVIEVN